MTVYPRKSCFFLPTRGGTVLQGQVGETQERHRRQRGLPQGRQDTQTIPQARTKKLLSELGFLSPLYQGWCGGFAHAQDEY